MDAKESRKLAKVKSKGYVRVGEVRIMTHQFQLPNGEGISMVYNGTYSGMNTSLWDPHFALPMVRSTIRAVDKGNFMVDQYI